MNTPTITPHKNGTLIRTAAQPDGSTDWTPGARDNCRWGVLGRIISHSDSHGLCYTVRHLDGSEAPYNHAEVEVQTPE